MGGRLASTTTAPRLGEELPLILDSAVIISPSRLCDAELEHPEEITCENGEIVYVDPRNNRWWCAEVYM